jgi:Domain of Unknown Function (DUF1080)
MLNARLRFPAFSFVILTLVSVPSSSAQNAWRIHDEQRPAPPAVQLQAETGAPSDAVVLFDGKSGDQWESVDGSSFPWNIESGVLQVKPGTGNIRSKGNFGDCQLHVEWSSPSPASETGQGRGNSGVFLMGLYEVQVLDAHDNPTYADGTAGAVYGQYPPLVNVAKQPGEWQTYDIIFHRPRFARGALVSPARITLLWNGVLVQDNVTLSGPTAWHDRPPYVDLGDELPLVLQDHGQPVRYRNIWLRRLPDAQLQLTPTAVQSLPLIAEDTKGLAGDYALADQQARISMDNGKVSLTLGTPGKGKPVTFPLMLTAESTFLGIEPRGALVIRVIVNRDNKGEVRSISLPSGGEFREYLKTK